MRCGLLRELAVHLEPMGYNIKNDEESEKSPQRLILKSENDEENGGGHAIREHIEYSSELGTLIEMSSHLTINSIETLRDAVANSSGEWLRETYREGENHKHNTSIAD